MYVCISVYRRSDHDLSRGADGVTHAPVMHAKVVGASIVEGTGEMRVLYRPRGACCMSLNICFPENKRVYLSWSRYCKGKADAAGNAGRAGPVTSRRRQVGPPPKPGNVEGVCKHSVYLCHWD